MGQDDAEGLQDGSDGDVTEILAGLLPAPAVALMAGAAGLGVAIVGTLVAGGSRRRGVRVPYTRKMYHIVVFTAAALVHLQWGMPGAVAYGTVMALVVLGAVAAGEGNLLYDALARDTDRPHRTLFILVPLATTAVGGLAAAWITGPFAPVGYLAAGWGDAAGEPIGSRWGRHTYRVPSLAGVAATRSWEGSAGVFVVATLGCTVALATLEGVPLWGGVVCGAVAAIAEGVSNHGLDNLTVQVAPALTAYLLFA